MKREIVMSLLTLLVFGLLFATCVGNSTIHVGHEATLQKIEPGSPTMFHTSSGEAIPCEDGCEITLLGDGLKVEFKEWTVEKVEHEGSPARFVFRNLVGGNESNQASITLTAGDKLTIFRRYRFGQDPGSIGRIELDQRTKR